MSAFSIHRHRSRQADRLVMGLAAGVAVALLGVLCARVAISHYGRTAIEALIGIPILIAIARRPVLAVTVLFAMVASTFAYGVLPRVNLPGHPPINVGDLAL